MAKWYERLGRNTLGAVTGGLAGNKNYGFLDNMGRGIGDYFMGPTRAARSQANAAKQGMQAQQQMFGQAMETQKPWLQTGEKHMRQLSDEVMVGGFNVKPGQFDYQSFQAPGEFKRPEYQEGKFNFEADPGYQFRMDQGNEAIKRGAAAMGGFASGATLKDLGSYSQGLASQEYGNAFNRFQGTEDRRRDRYTQDLGFDYGQYSDDYKRKYGQHMDDFGIRYGMFGDDYNRQRQFQGDRYGRMSDVTGIGQQAAGNVAEMYMNQGQNLSNAYNNVGNASANRSMAMQNTINPWLNFAAQGLGAYAGSRG